MSLSWGWAGAALSAGIGALTGFIGGGTGGLAANLVRGGGQALFGVLGAGAGNFAGGEVGSIAESLATGKKYQFDPYRALANFAIGAGTLGLGAEVGAYGNPENMAAKRVFSPGQQTLFRYVPYSDAYDSPFVSAYAHEVGFVAAEQRAYETSGELFKSLVGLFF